MRILFWHGWMLTGSGSNIYTASLAREWRRTGHDVLLLCQDRTAARFDFVDAQGDFAEDNASFQVEEKMAQGGRGRCVVARPNIGRVLPVFVLNPYPGFEPKIFVELADDELLAYVERNVAAMRTAIQMHRPDVIIVGHEVMGPYIALQACDSSDMEYTGQLHGSGLEYAVKKQQRYRRFAIAGLSGARTVIGSSRYMISAALAAAPGWGDKTAVVNLGCDVDLFCPVPRDPDAPFTIGFVGALIENKGVHLLLAALPLIDRPEIRAVIVGTGSFRPALQDMWLAIQRGDRATLSDFRTRGTDHVRALMATVDIEYFRRARAIEVEFVGHLDHEPLSKVLPHFDALAVPSILPEAFGLVAAEAASSGVLPVVPDHSGIGEVGAAVEEHLGQPGLLTFQSPDPIVSLAGTLNAIAKLSAEDRARFEGAASELARERWSWEVVAQRLLKAALD